MLNATSIRRPPPDVAAPYGATPIVFLDFDGTITRRDATDAILEAYADPRWLDIEEEWKRERLSSRDCLIAQMALVTATQHQVDALLDEIEVDDGFVPLLDTCAAHGVPVHIISDGFDYCIKRILSRPSVRRAASLKNVQIISSHLEPDGVRWNARFTNFGPSCTHRCATCKPTTMARLNTTNGPAIFVGDGLSDKYAAGCADLVFAKDKLATFCDEHRIAYTPYDHLTDVARLLDRVLEGHAALADAAASSVGA